MSSQLGTAERPLRVAIIGAGPSGFYAAGGLLKDKKANISIDMFESLPVPHGLVRYGVAPDHQNIKAVSKVYDRTANDPRMRLFGNVAFGEDITHEDFKALYDKPFPPSLVYFHENQLTYPLAPGERMDYQFGFTNITTALAADKIFFNSRTHYEAFFSALPGFLKMMPEYRPKWVLDDIRRKSDVLFPGCRIPADETKTSHARQKPGQPPLIIWNHRWEFDKNPEDFFDALDAVSRNGLDFRIALLGENFQAVPKAFISAKKRFGEKIVRYGYEESREDYFQWLSRGDAVISTAHQENFGISVVEAVRYGCIPLLPRRLSYPEIIPRKYHPHVLYKDTEDLTAKLRLLLSDVSGFREMTAGLSREMGRYAWENLIRRYDAALENLVKEI